MQIIRNRTIFDVCIVGSGAGGGMAAKVLTEAGADVIMLEAGAPFDPARDSHVNAEVAAAILRHALAPSGGAPRHLAEITSADGDRAMLVVNSEGGAVAPRQGVARAVRKHVLGRDWTLAQVHECVDSSPPKLGLRGPRGDLAAEEAVAQVLHEQQAGVIQARERPHEREPGALVSTRGTPEPPCDTQPGSPTLWRSPGGRCAACWPPGPRWCTGCPIAKPAAAAPGLPRAAGTWRYA